ncbi:putative amino acid permease 7 isoform X2 [Panicum miliaceum]|uniref:Amino acid permease 7 isoform X2 n=1 Tax=Panicum miliaceum TaxID=4540 RepID=A0A3L6QF44_PANMI|nr:putative amino acid permease 7 isoform X2 [Panicum miliaceum]
MGSGGGDGDGGRQAQPLLGKLSESSSGEHLVKRTGTVWTAMAHIITAVIGSGVLSLAWSVAQLGWVGGPAAMVFFAGVTAVQSSLIADCYISHDPERGVVRNRSYVDAVRLYLGEKSHLFCGFFLNFSLFGTGVVYTLTSATSMRAIQRANCYHREGHDAPCSVVGDGYYMLLFGLAQVVLSQIPGFHEMAGLSVFAAVMSFFYAFVGVGLGVAKVIANGVIMGGIGGIPMVSTTQKVWRVSQALGDILFAYPFSLVLLEIEDTLRSPPPENETMKTATRTSIVITAFFYLCCGCLGYAAFGDGTPGNLLTGFGFYEPYWLIDLANLCIVLHLLGGYQVYTQPVFGFADRHFGGAAAEVPVLGARRVNVFRLCFRTAYVAATTALAVWFPYFNEVIGLLGAFTFWPLAIYFPVEMYLKRNKVTPWTRQWLAIHGFSSVCLLISAFASVGSAVGVFGSETS